jgi:hypothetical protein
MLDRNFLRSFRRNTDLLLTLTIIGLLVFVMIFWMDPERRMAEARNAQRFSNTESILNAIKLYQVDHDGKTPPQVNHRYRMLGTAKSGCNVPCGVGGIETAESCIDMRQTLGGYMDNLPIDPLYGDTERSFYAVAQTQHDKTIRVVSCGAELGRYIQRVR